MILMIVYVLYMTGLSEKKKNKKNMCDIMTIGWYVRSNKKYIW